jgi:hypothetical protein
MGYCILLRNPRSVCSKVNTVIVFYWPGQYLWPGPQRFCDYSCRRLTVRGADPRRRLKAGSRCTCIRGLWGPTAGAQSQQKSLPNPRSELSSCEMISAAQRVRLYRSEMTFPTKQTRVARQIPHNLAPQSVGNRGSRKLLQFVGYKSAPTFRHICRHIGR